MDQRSSRGSASLDRDSARSTAAASFGSAEASTAPSVSAVNLLPQEGQLVCGRTIRTRWFGIPGRVVNHQGRHILRLPARWPWEHVYLTTLANLRWLPQVY